ncbi:DNA replication protein [Alphaproteobacteria bacterium]|nr:DNA replication protein [Alphaproteobacteria bacterium]
MQQIPMDLSFRSAQGRDNFFISKSNQLAAEWIDRWPDWPGQIQALNVVGDPGSGKSHLAAVWQEQSGAVKISNPDGDMVHSVVEENGKVPCFILDNMTPQTTDDEALFHFLNAIMSVRGSLLILSPSPIAQMTWGLADLLSRLKAINVVQIGLPDDVLLFALLEKFFIERQLVAPHNMLHYIVSRMDRSFSAVHKIGTALDREALAGKKNLSVNLARDVLHKQLEIGF